MLKFLRALFSRNCIRRRLRVPVARWTVPSICFRETDRSTFPPSSTPLSRRSACCFAVCTPCSSRILSVSLQISICPHLSLLVSVCLYQDLSCPSLPLSMSIYVCLCLAPLVSACLCLIPYPQHLSLPGLQARDVSVSCYYALRRVPQEFFLLSRQSSLGWPVIDLSPEERE